MPEDRPKDPRRNPQDMGIVCGTNTVEVRRARRVQRGSARRGRATQRAAWEALKKAEEGNR
jgi:hypothetical protein